MASKSISTFFANLGFPVRNPRWSWGACADRGILLSAWDDQKDSGGHAVRVLGAPAVRDALSSRGLDERIDHLRALWSGGLPGYVVIATAKDIAAHPRTIKFYDDQNVRAVDMLIEQPDGSIWAELGEVVPVRNLAKHAARHRLKPGIGPFPIPHKSRRTPPADKLPAAYVAQLPAMRAWLIELARKRGTATYADARAPFNMRSLEHRHAMDRVGHACLDAGEPILTALIVDRTTGRCSNGFFKEFRRDDADEREDCYRFWQDEARPGDVTPAPAGNGSGTETLQARAALFAKAAVRPDQAAFRRRVFMAYRGACVVTGCKIDAALDAAHREGRDWRLGHNSAEDGLLLRKDIHALYDAGKVRIGADGVAAFDPGIADHYRHYLNKT